MKIKTNPDISTHPHIGSTERGEQVKSQKPVRLEWSVNEHIGMSFDKSIIAYKITAVKP